jgi:hypothetical protein
MSLFKVSKDQNVLMYRDKSYTFIDNTGHKDGCNYCALREPCYRNQIDSFERLCGGNWRVDGRSGYWFHPLHEYVQEIKVKKMITDNRTDEEKIVADLILG